MKKSEYNPAIFITLTIVYFGACGGLWHYGYWSRFKINYLQFIGITDIIKDFAFPFLSACGLFVITFLLQIILTQKKENKHINSDNNHVKLSKFQLFCIRNKEYICLIYLMIILVVDIKYNILGHELIPYLLYWPFVTMTFNKQFVAKVLVNRNLRSSFLSFLFFLPISSFCFAKHLSSDIYYNITYEYISFLKFNDKDDMNSKRLIGYKYLGSASNKIFITNAINSEITIINMDNIKVITYRKVNPNTKK